MFFFFTENLAKFFNFMFTIDNEVSLKTDFYSLLPELFLLGYLLYSLIVLVVYMPSGLNINYITNSKKRILKKNLILKFALKLINFLVFLFLFYFICFNTIFFSKKKIFCF